MSAVRAFDPSAARSAFQEKDHMNAPDAGCVKAKLLELLSRHHFTDRPTRCQCYECLWARKMLEVVSEEEKA